MKGHLPASVHTTAAGQPALQRQISKSRVKNNAMGTIVFCTVAAVALGVYLNNHPSRIVRSKFRNALARLGF